MVPSRHLATWSVLGALLALVAPIVGAAVASLVFPQFRLTSLPLHALVEGAGGLVALAIALILLAERGHKADSDHHLWMVVGFISMGVLDLFHAATSPGDLFIWLRTLASLFGGLCFACVWLPVPTRQFSRDSAFLIAACFFSIAVGGMSVLGADYLPRMRTPEGSFTIVPIAGHFGSGLGFLASSLFFWRRFCRNYTVEDWLFSVQSALFSAAGFLFCYSVIWDGGWWWWHVLRLAAYLAA